MNKKIFIGFIILSLLVGGYFLYSKQTHSKHERKILYYQGGMHPEVKSDKPGKCPICGMDLVPVYEEDKAQAKADRGKQVSLNKNQLKHLNVQTAIAKVGPLVKEIRAAGEVAYDPELLVAQEEYLSALESGLLVDSSRRKLKVLGLSAQEINNLTRADQSLILPAKQMWVYADIYEQELSWVKAGQKAKVTSVAFPGQEFYGSITAVEPILESMSRSAKVRIKVSNPKLLLQPKMFVDVYIIANQRPSLIVPRSAVLDTGKRKVAYVEKAAGVFEPREVKVGPAGKEFIPILHGLTEGEKVVTSANFLIDSETQLTGGSSALYGGAKEVKDAKHNH